MPPMMPDVASIIGRAEAALQRSEADDDATPPSYFVQQLVESYSARQLRQLVHDGELELLAAEYWDDPTAGWWQELVASYRAALDCRKQADARASSTRRGRHIDFAALKARTDIVDFVSGYVTLTRAGKAWRGLCPFHVERTASFYVWPSGRWKCFGCDAGGDVIDFAKRVGDLARLLEVG